MAVKIRLMRMGTKKKPHFRIVASDTRFARDGRFLEKIGYYDPSKEPELFSINKERVFYWLSKGAQVTDRIRALLKREKINIKEYREAIKKAKK
jgi:small subunit ribosomal protein S16